MVSSRGMGAVVATVFSLSINCWRWKSCFCVCVCVPRRRVWLCNSDALSGAGEGRSLSGNLGCHGFLPCTRRTACHLHSASHCLGCRGISMQSKGGSLGIEAILGYKMSGLSREGPPEKKCLAA